MSLGYRTAGAPPLPGAPPPPGASNDLPPGYVSREEKSRAKRHQKNTSRVKIAIGALILLVCVGITIALTMKNNAPKVLADVKEGQCFKGEFDDLTIVDCGASHTSELVKIVPPDDAEANAAYPGKDALTQSKGNICSVNFVQYFGAPVEVATAAGIELFPIVPTEAQWNDGVKDSFCLAGKADQSEFKGSIKGQGAAATPPAGGTATTAAAPAASGG
jgi:hypothetical protein